MPQMPRHARLDSPGTLHHVIVRGIERRKIVDDDCDREDFTNRMGKIAEDSQTQIYAWALMTNHAHIFLRSGPYGLSLFMRRLLTGYAVSYNRRHGRHGHLFQNRYKSVVCEEDPYFQELVRYIHLNPLRVGLVRTLSQLDRYPWSGHRAVMGKIKRSWQDVDYVLSWFGGKVSQARKAYREFVKDGISAGRRPELVGGGLIRSLGGWSQVLSMRRRGEKSFADDRILGSSDFVKHMIEEADERLKIQLSADQVQEEADRLIREMCKREGVSMKELRTGSRRRHVSQARTKIATALVDEVGLSMAEAARRLGVTTPAISRALRKVHDRN